MTNTAAMAPDRRTRLPNILATLSALVSPSEMFAPEAVTSAPKSFAVFARVMSPTAVRPAVLPTARNFVRNPI